MVFINSAGFKRYTVFVVLVLGLIFTGPVSARETIVFVDWSWDSARVHNRIAGFIAEHAFGHQVDYLFADDVPGVQAMRRGDIHVSMETWVNNLPVVWDEGIEEGSIIDLGRNYPNAPQGFYVPTYVIEGDPERGIEPVAPDLKSVLDLPKYWEAFRDRENPRKGRFYNGVTAWVISSDNVDRLKAFGLDEYFEVFYPGSQAALDTSIIRAYDRGEPWVGYYWEPTWIMGALDMTMLDVPVHQEKCLSREADDVVGCSFPVVDVRIGAHASLLERAPEFIEFLKKYATELEHTNATLAYIEIEGGNDFDAAKWFLREYEELWSAWLDDDKVAKVKAAL